MTDLRKNLIERRFIELDPELAKHYLTLNTFEAQRDPKPDHIKELSEKMEDGRFRFGEVAFAYYPNGGQQDIMMNGQNICHAAMATGITIPCVLERFKIENKRPHRAENDAIALLQLINVLGL